MVADKCGFPNLNLCGPLASANTTDSDLHTERGAGITGVTRDDFYMYEQLFIKLLCHNLDSMQSDFPAGKVWDTMPPIELLKGHVEYDQIILMLHFLLNVLHCTPRARTQRSPSSRREMQHRPNDEEY